MKLRKIISFALALILCLGLFAGCGPANSGDNGPEISDDGTADYKNVEFMVAWWGSDARHNYTMEALEEFDKQFLNLRTSVVYSGWGDYFSTVIDIPMAGGNPPDVFQITFDKIPAYAAAGKLMKLDDYIKNGDINTTNVEDSSIQMGAYNGNVYGIATGVSTSVYAYSNTDALKAGITLSRTPTLDEVVAAAKKMYNYNGKKIYIEFTDYVRMRGASYYNEDGTAVGFSAQILADWWAFEKQAIAEGWFIGPKDGIDSYQTGVIEGKVWFLPIAANQVISLEDKANLDIEWIAVPSAENKAASFSQPNTLWVVSSSCQNPELAVALLDFFTNNEAYFDLGGIDRGIPISSAITDYLEPTLDDAAKLQITILSELSAAGAFGPMPASSVNDSKAKQELTDYNQLNKYGKIADADMLATAQEAIDAMNSVLK
jgi:multiple sugar transport system substrate-binding protein